MLLGIDHIVIAVRDPDAAADRLSREAGLAAGGGGRHEGRGTFNRLVWLGDSYLELIGVDDPIAARRWGVGSAALALLEGGREGLAAFAIASDDLAGDVATLRRSGSPYGDPWPGQRRRPDGAVVRWQTALPDRLGADGLPFLIEHDLAGAEWDEPSRAERAAFVHPIGGRAQLALLELAVSDPAAAAERNREAAGLAPIGGTGTGTGTGAAPELRVGQQRLRFVRPAPATPSAGIVIAATAGWARSADLLGCRFTIGPALDVQ